MLYVIFVLFLVFCPFLYYFYIDCFLISWMCERKKFNLYFVFGVFQNSILCIPYFVLSLMSLLSLLWLCHYCYCLKCYHWALVKASRSQDSYKQTPRPTRKLLELLRAAQKCPTEAQADAADMPELWVGEESYIRHEDFLLLRPPPSGLYYPPEIWNKLDWRALVELRPPYIGKLIR